MENLFRCIQRHAGLRVNRLEDHVHAWRAQSSARKPWADLETGQASWSAGSGIALWFAVGWSWERNVRVGWKRERSQLYLRKRHSIELLEGPGYRFGLQSPSGRRGGLWVLRQETASHHLQCSQLLWIILELGSCNERRWVSDVLVSNPQVFQEEKVILWINHLISALS